MKTILELTAAAYADLQAHLLPPNCQEEQAAFLFVVSSKQSDRLVFRVCEMAKLTSADFAAQSGDYIEMADTTRARLIKRAHDLGASLVEIHSHLGPWPARFSWSDRAGLRETVPHMWWRLARRPYVALVVASSGFDAWVWVKDPHTPQALDELIVGRKVLYPTNESAEDWAS
jgi:hypothetical protein